MSSLSRCLRRRGHASQAALRRARPLGNLGNHNISGGCASADEVKLLTASYGEILGQVNRNICCRAVGRNCRGRINGGPDRNRGYDTYLMGLCVKVCRGLRGIG